MIRHLLFDLDNTLYPAAMPMEREVTERMVRFVADFLGVGVEEARAIRKAQSGRSSTTLEWLMTAYNFSDAARFFEAVHPASEIDELVFDPRLRDFLISLDLPMSVLTNAPRVHADRVLSFYNIADLFLAVSDIETNNLKGKPYKSAFVTALEAAKFSVEETLFFDDFPSYVAGFEALGGKTVLVGANAEPSALSAPNRFSIKTIYETPRVLRALRDGE